MADIKKKSGSAYIFHGMAAYHSYFMWKGYWFREYIGGSSVLAVTLFDYFLVFLQNSAICRAELGVLLGVIYLSSIFALGKLCKICSMKKF